MLDLYLYLYQIKANISEFILGKTIKKFGVWVQGCTINCTGCMSAATHTKESSQSFSISINQLLNMIPDDATGLVISGGEPTEQYEAILELLQHYRAKYHHEGAEYKEVILYSGRSLKALCQNFPKLFSGLIDVIVAEPYVDHLPATPMSGSSNQKLVLCTPYAEKNYSDLSDWPTHNRMVIYPPTVDDESITIVGIPNSKHVFFRG